MFAFPPAANSMIDSLANQPGGRSTLIRGSNSTTGDGEVVKL
jgi:hypothetical protein